MGELAEQIAVRTYYGAAKLRVVSSNRSAENARVRVSRMPVQWKAGNKASTSGGLRPHVASVVENSLTSKRQPKAQTVPLAYCDKRFEQPIANARRNSRPCIFDFDQHVIAGRFGSDVDLSPARPCFQGVGNQVGRTRTPDESISGGSTCRLRGREHPEFRYLPMLPPMQQV